MIAVDYIAQQLKQRGLLLFCYPGGTILPLLDACHKAGVRVVVARSEAGAGYAAIGAAKATGQTQVVAVTSGPGATNLVTAIADAHYDGVPIIALTGQVGMPYVEESKRSFKRQAGFQQTPITDVVRPISVMAMQARSPEAMAAMFDIALDKTTSGDRAGPVLIDMPMDVQRAEVKHHPPYTPANKRSDPCEMDKADQVYDLLRQSKRPIVLAGAGCLPSYLELRAFVERTQIRVVSSLPSVGIIPTDWLQWRGMIGHTGHACANRELQAADLVLALGTRLDMRQTGTEKDKFAPDATIVRVDKSSAEMDGSRVRIDLPVLGDCGEFLFRLLQHDLHPLGDDYDYAPLHPDPYDQVAHVMREISVNAPADGIITTGVGSHQQHAARWLWLDCARRKFITSAGHGCMGAGLPMAIGAVLATGQPAVVVDGDGSFQMSMAELGTVAQYGLSDLIDIHIIENGVGGIVSQFARLNGWPTDETTWPTPDFERIADAYGLRVSCHVVDDEGVWPILEGGHTLDDMTPFTGGQA